MTPATEVGGDILAAIDCCYEQGRADGHPPSIVKRINEVMREALARPEVSAKLTTQGAPPVPSSPEEHTEFMRAEIALTEKMMKAARLEAQ